VPPSAPPTYRHYVALGDSFAAAPLVPVTDVANGCFRSTGNYPTRVAHALGAELEDRSCGGATTRDLHRAQFPGVPPQLSALDRRTDVVTFGLGGNDDRVFGRLTEYCPRLRDRDPGGAPCRQAMSGRDGDELLSAIRRTRPRLVRSLQEVQRRAPRAELLVVGYPQMVDPRNACDRLPLATGDYAYAYAVNRALDQNLRRAAARVGARFVDVWSASAGHDICARQPWINGATAVRDRAAAYHPFAVEQQAVSRLVLRRLRAAAN
jgi:hypothetical protein